MIDSREALTDALWHWLEQSDTLTEARRFLSQDPTSKRSGLGDGQIANWRRKKTLPDTFLEGAALYHCALAEKPLIDPEETGLTGSSFWQVFVVGNPAQFNQPIPKKLDSIKPKTTKPKIEKLDCAILRYWQDVQALGDDGYLSHVAYRSRSATVELNEKDKEKEKPKVEELGGTGTKLEIKHENDGNLFVRWQIDREARDHGYTVNFPEAITHGRNELVGGTPTIAVGSAHLLVFLPKSSVDRLKRPANPHGLPDAVRMHVTGSPVRVMEGYLGISEADDNENTNDVRRLGPWFRTIQHVEQGPGIHPLPLAISENKIYRNASEWVDAGEFKLFSVHVDRPLPFLTYALAF